MRQRETDRQTETQRERERKTDRDRKTKRDGKKEEENSVKTFFKKKKEKEKRSRGKARKNIYHSAKTNHAHPNMTSSHERGRSEGMMSHLYAEVSWRRQCIPLVTSTND